MKYHARCIHNFIIIHNSRGFFSKVFVANSRGREEPFIIYIAKDDKRLQSNKSIQNLVGVFSSNPVLVISCNSPQKKGWLLDRLANQRNSASSRRKKSFRTVLIEKLLYHSLVLSIHLRPRVSASLGTKFRALQLRVTKFQ